MPPHADKRTLKEGYVKKWTNIYSSWKTRWFAVESGALVYARLKSDKSRTTVLLDQSAKIKKMHGTLTIEVEHVSGVLYMQFESFEEKNAWLSAIYTASGAIQRSRPEYIAVMPNQPNVDRTTRSIDGSQSPTNASSASCAEVRVRQSVVANDEDHVTASVQDGLVSQRRSLSGSSVVGNKIARKVDVNEEMHPLKAFLDNCALTRQVVDSTGSEIRRAQSKLIRAAASSRDQNLRDEVKHLVLRIVTLLDRLQNAFESHLHVAELAITEEHSQMRRVEKSLKLIAKQNYEMETEYNRLSNPAVANGRKTDNGVVVIDPHAFDREDVSTMVDGDGCIRDRHVDIETARSRSEEVAVRSTNSFCNRDMVSDDDDYDETGSLEFFDAEDQTESASPAAEPVSSGQSTPHGGMVVVKRRTHLPKPRTAFKVRLWTLLKGCIGKDLSRISMPVYFNEPTSLLQRIVEDNQYLKTIERAVTSSSPIERLLWVTIFTITPYASAVGRTHKPFNPLLGETAEVSHRGFKFIAEQVGHHPPVSAYFCEGRDYVLWGSMMVSNRFTGTSLEVTMPGAGHVYLPNTAERDHYTFNRAKMAVKNIVFGTLQLDLFGVVTVVNHITGDYAVLEYLPKGWWGTEFHRMRGAVFNANGVPFYRIGGNWSHEIWVEDCVRNRDVPIGWPQKPPPPPPPRDTSSSVGHGFPKMTQSASECRLPEQDRFDTSPLGNSRRRGISHSHTMHPFSSGTQASGGDRSNSAAADENNLSGSGAMYESAVPVQSPAEESTIGSIEQSAEGLADELSKPQTSLCDGLRCLAKTPPVVTSDDLTIDWGAIETDTSTHRVVWRPDPRPPHTAQYYNFGALTFELNDLSADYDPRQGAVMPPTDSRFRPDLRAYEHGEIDVAHEEKNRLEDAQRGRASERVNGEEDYTPRWFFRGKSSVTGEPCWLYNGEYWKEKEAGVFNGCMPVFGSPTPWDNFDELKAAHATTRS